MSGWYVLGALVAILLLVGLWVSRTPSLHRPYGRLAAATVLGWPLVGMLSLWWTDYWLSVDAQRGVAVITGEHSHRVVDYRYTVNQREYTGRSQKNWEEKEFRNVGIGDKSVVFFSSSHPWLSSLQTPGFSAAICIPFLFVLGLEIAFVAAVIGDIPRWVRSFRKPTKPLREDEETGDQ